MPRAVSTNSFKMEERDRVNMIRTFLYFRELPRNSVINNYFIYYKGVT